MDIDLRRLERDAATGDPMAAARLRQARRRAGVLPTAGEYVRLDGAHIGRPEATGNWRIMGMLAAGDTLTLVPVSADRRVRLPSEFGRASSYLVTLTAGDLERARVAYDDELPRLNPLRVPCPRCDAESGEGCFTPSGGGRRPHAVRGVVPPLQPVPPPLPVVVGAPRQRPSKVRVVESRSRNADIRITALDLAPRAADESIV